MHAVRITALENPQHAIAKEENDDLWRLHNSSCAHFSAPLITTGFEFCTYTLHSDRCVRKGDYIYA